MKIYIFFNFTGNEQQLTERGNWTRKMLSLCTDLEPVEHKTNHFKASIYKYRNTED